MEVWRADPGDMESEVDPHGPGKLKTNCSHVNNFGHGEGAHEARSQFL